MSLYIADASVVARFLLTEDLSNKAELVLKDYLEGKISIASPKLMIYEVGNVLWKAVKLRHLSLEEAKERIAHLIKLRITLLDLEDGDYGEVLEYGSNKDITYYDSVYVVLSKKLGGILLTADDALYSKVKKDVDVMHLRDYGI